MNIALKVTKHLGASALVMVGIVVPHWLVSLVAPIPGM